MRENLQHWYPQMATQGHVLPPCGCTRVLQQGTGGTVSPAGVEEDVDECGGDGRQRVRVQRHDAEVVEGDQHRVDRRVDG